MKLKIFTFFLLIFALAAAGFAQTKSQNSVVATNSKTANVQIFPLADVKEGMRGTARTVFRGTEPEDFNVEILGVLPDGVGPKQDLIIGKIGGGQADRTFVFAGMSGSPVYIDGKLVGAISYSFPFAKEPICGITPVEQMIKIFEQNQASKPTQPRAVSFGELASTDFKSQFPMRGAISSVSASSSMPTLAGQTFQPIATPVSFSGFSQETLNTFAPQLLSAGLLPVASVGGGAKMSPMEKFTDNTLLGGTSVSMQLTRGDYSMAAAGTVTFRDGEKIYAFGHPFLSLGSSDLPMSESSVVTVVPNINNSFKIAVPNAMVGTMTQDRATGVFGKLGQSPKMIPVKLNLETSRGQTETLNFEVAKDNFLTPLLVNIGIFNALLANERGIGESTINVDGFIKLKNQNPIKIERRFTGNQASQMAAGSVAVPVNTLLRSGFDETEISEINVNISSNDGTKSAILERIALDRTEVKAGESFEIQAYIRTNTGQVLAQKIPVSIPKDTPAGTVLVSLGDGSSIQQVSASRVFVPKNLGELVKTINEVKKNDRLYAQTYRITNGAIIGAKELPNLPPSVLATLNNDRTAGGFTPTVLTVLTEQEVAPADYVISGQQVLTLEVVK